jgi:hypothetical protein
MSGEPLNVKRLLHDPDGKPCLSIISIAHLNDKERMFFVTILLNEILTWVRRQSGTSSLRALLYMDEVFGYFPPTSNPPSKQPMLTLLKQARAFGLGVVLATQNPVDLDYKGLSNTGTWFLGRLQTERDKARVLEGLEGASAQSGSSFDRGQMEKTLAGLRTRMFLMNNVHDDQPVIFETRWAMSYLRGPLTRNQIQKLVEFNDPGIRETEQSQPERAAVREPIAAVPVKEDPRLLIPQDIRQSYVTVSQRVGSDLRLVYRPALLAKARVHYVRASYKLDHWMQRTFLATVRAGMMPNEIWADSEIDATKAWEFDDGPLDRAEFAELPSEFGNAKNYSQWEKELSSFLYRESNLAVWKCDELAMYSQPEESLGDFKVRIEQKSSEMRDAEVEKLRKKYASKFQTRRDALRRAEERVAREEQQYKQSRTSTLVSIGQTIMGAVLGRRTSTSAGTSIRSYSRSSKEKGDIGRAEENLESEKRRYEELESDFNRDVESLDEKYHVDQLNYEELSVAPKKTDITVIEFGLCWLPWCVSGNGIAEPVY